MKLLGKMKKHRSSARFNSLLTPPHKINRSRYRYVSSMTTPAPSHEAQPRVWSNLGGWLFTTQMAHHASYSTQALASAVIRGYSDVVANLIKSGIDWRQLTSDELSAMYGLVSDPELKATIAAWVVASELEGFSAL